jgi:hypothetical protein
LEREARESPMGYEFREDRWLLRQETQVNEKKRFIAGDGGVTRA